MSNGQNNAPELNELDKKAMRKYFLELLVIPGPIAAVFVFFFGFYMNDVAKSDALLESKNAYIESLKQSHRIVNSLTESVVSERKNVEFTGEKVQQIHKESQVILGDLKGAKVIAESVKDQKAIATSLAALWKEDPPVLFQDIKKELLEGKPKLSVSFTANARSSGQNSIPMGKREVCFLTHIRGNKNGNADIMCRAEKDKGSNEWKLIARNASCEAVCLSGVGK